MALTNYYCFREIIDGIVVFDENNNPVGKSKKAAAKGITQVVISRVTMAAPGMSEFTSHFSKLDFCLEKCTGTYNTLVNPIAI